jgi:thiol-disulfide isomerase/thioredoxin
MFPRNGHAAQNRLAFLLLLCGFVVAVCEFSAAAQSTVDLGGKPVDPIKFSEGKIAVLIFVRTDCPISNRYAPLLQHFQDEYAGKAKFWLVFPGAKTGPQQIAEYLRQFHYSIPALRDMDFTLVKRAGASITPEAAVFDARGRLLYHGRIDNLYESPGRARPAATTRELQSVLDATVAGKPSPLAAAPAVGCYISDLE